MHLLSPQWYQVWREWVIFLSNIQSETLKDFQSPLENFLDSQQKEDFCLVSLSACNRYKDTAVRRQERPRQQRRSGFSPLAWDVPIPSPDSSSLLCFLQIFLAMGS